MREWVIWLVVAVGLVVAEMFSLSLVLIMFAAGALAAAVVAGAGQNLLVQSIAFAVVSALALAVARPLIRKRLQPSGALSRTGIDALRGASAVVLEQVTEHAGLVKIGGETWTARTSDNTQLLAPGMTVEVVDIKGVTALVRRK